MAATASWGSMQIPPAPADAGAFPEPVSAPSFLPPPKVGKHALVAAAHPLASRAGVEVLQRGGNAIDAAVAVQLVLNVVEPQSSGIGGGLFLVYFDAGSKEIVCLDGREEVPAAADRRRLLDAAGNVRADALTGGACVGVPGTVAALHAAHARFGKLPWKEVFAPALDLARNGAGVTPRLRLAIEVNRPRFLLFPSSRAAFLNADDSVPEIGQVRRQPDLARTLEQIAESGPAAFYQGKIAEQMVKAVNEAAVSPGQMTLADLKAYQPLWREPLRFTHQDCEIVGMPPPSSGTVALAQMLAVLRTVPAAQRRPGSPAEIDLLARAESVAFADREAYLGDPAFSDLPMTQLLESTRLAERAAAARALRPGTRAKPGPRPGGKDAAEPAEVDSREGDNTTHFSIVDPAGNVVAVTTTLEHGMGCGLVVPGAGFLLNNELTDFDLPLERGPNALETRRLPGPAGGTVGKRPRSSMTPLIVLREGRPCLTLGSPGGSQIIGVVTQTLVGVMDHGLDMQSAINLPRVSCRNRGRLQLEGLYANRADLVRQLEALGWSVEPLAPGYEAWGGAQGIRVRPDGLLEGGADPRREGAVRGW